MTEQQPHVEVFSRNRVNRSTIVVAIIPTTIFSLVLVYALWSFLWIVAYVVLALLLLSSLYLVALAAIDIRRRWIHAHIVHLGEHGVVDAMGWRMLPLALPEPQVTVSEEKEDDEEMQRAKVLLYHDIGKSIRDIADLTGVKPWKVQKWTSEYEANKKAQKVKQ